MNTPDSPHLDACMEQLALVQQRLSGFVRALLPNPADADEVLQETNIVIWQKVDQFDPERPGSDFLSWAFRIAALQAKNYRRRQARKPGFSEELMEELAVAAVGAQPMLEARREALGVCMQGLPDEERVLVEQCYAPGAQIYEVAETLTRTPTSVYRSLRRIRRALSVCIQSRLAGAAS
ncbi:MAG: RNA polymerase sigma-70 factor (ECF subfamily) [Rhodothermales bacterium]|jgi:RNA polymerase sigma-70 factor (ECF subfamily)